jgi:hypothetical protein
VQRKLADRAELDVAIVSPGAPEPLQRVGRELGLTVPLLSDPAWSTYRAFGFGRAGAGTLLFSPRAWWAGFRSVLKGRRPRRPTEDYAELGGDVLLAPDGRVAWIRRSRSAADRPGPSEVLRNLRGPRFRATADG